MESASGSADTDIEALYGSISSDIDKFMEKYVEYMKLSFDDPSSDGIHYFVVVESCVRQSYREIREGIKRLKERIAEVGGRCEKEYYAKVVKKEETFNKYVSKFLAREEENRAILNGINVEKILEKEKKMNDPCGSNYERELMLEQEQLERSQQKLFQLKEIVHQKNNNVLNCSDKEQQELNAILKDIQEVMGFTEQKVKEGNMQLIDIEQQIAETEEKIALAKEELKSAARHNVSTQNAKGMFTGVLGGGIIGTVLLPGIGSVLGAIGGGYIGKLYSKLNKKALDNIENKYKSQKENK